MAAIAYWMSAGIRYDRAARDMRTASSMAMQQFEQTGKVLRLIEDKTLAGEVIDARKHDGV